MKTLFIVAFLLFTPAWAMAESGLDKFLSTAKAPVGKQYFLGKFKVPGAMARPLKKTKWGSGKIVERAVIQVSNETLHSFLQNTSKKYLEVMFPAAKGRIGHVYFRYGKEVLDFHPTGLRVGEVRPINSDRYAMMVPLTAEQEQAVKSYFKDMKSTWQKSLGEYDFKGKKGFHCVSWIMRQALDSQGRNLAQILGHSTGKPGGVVKFSRFMLKQANPVEGVILLKKTPLNVKRLGKFKFDLIKSRQLRRAFKKGNYI